MPFPIIAFMGLCKICAVVGGAIFCTHQVAKAYEKKQKTQQNKIDANLQISQDKLKSAQEAIKQAQAENAEWRKKIEEKDQREEEFEKRIKELSARHNDPNLSKEEKDRIALEIVTLKSEVEKIRDEKKNFLDKIRGNDKIISDSNRTVNSTGANSGSYDNDKHWIYDLLTLENMLILGGCYILYKLVKDEK